VPKVVAQESGVVDIARGVDADRDTAADWRGLPALRHPQMVECLALPPGLCPVQGGLQLPPGGFEHAGHVRHEGKQALASNLVRGSGANPPVIRFAAEAFKTLE
jgi:hypothetical protein